MIRKLSLSTALGLVLAAGLAAGALAQSQSSAVNAAYSNNNKPGGASTYQPPIVAGDNAKPGGASTHQPPIIAGDNAKPGGASRPLATNQ